MAHRLTGAGDTDGATAPDDDDDTHHATVGRRNYLGLAAAAIATLAAAGRTAAAALPDGGTDPPTRTLLIRGGEGVSRYELTVGGALAGGDDDEDARISGKSVEGVVRDGNRRYRFDGEIRDLTVDGAAEVRLDTSR